MNKLDSVITKLDSYISTMKKLCLGVFALLTVKNSFTGTRNIARKIVSENFKAQCKNEKALGNFKTDDECLNAYSSQIKMSTDKTERYMDEVNNKIKGKEIDKLSSKDFSAIDPKMRCGDFDTYKKAMPSR